MKLSAERRKLLREERDIIANEACDACGAILGCVRFTRRGESGEWCSRQCRDGKAQAAELEARRAARAGRPRKHNDNAEKQRAYRQRQHPVLDRYETPEIAVSNQ